jgi:thiamine pyrophosphokinase
MSLSTFTILLGGNLTITDRVSRAITGSRVIAADSGMRHAADLGVTPELWVGDFDSSDAELVQRFSSVEQRTYPPAKNETDGEIATAEALHRGARRLILLGALGGERSDHALQHLLHAMSLAKRGLDILLMSGEEEAVPFLPGNRRLDLPKGTLFSILGFTPLAGLDITGARFPLKDFSLPFGSSRTVSNVAEGPVDFHLREGEAMIIARPHDFSGA